MEPISILSLACNIVQLVSFAGDLLSKGFEIQQATNGSIVRNNELESVTRELREFIYKLRTSPRETNPHNPVSQHTERSLQALCQNCIDVATELVEALEKLKLRGNRNIWNSMRQALGCVWAEPKINTLSQKLELYRRQIDTVLLFSLRYAPMRIIHSDLS